MNRSPSNLYTRDFEWPIRIAERRSVPRRSPTATILAGSGGSSLAGSDSAGCCKESRHLHAENVGAGSFPAKGESRPICDLRGAHEKARQVSAGLVCSEERGPYGGRDRYRDGKLVDSPTPPHRTDAREAEAKQGEGGWLRNAVGRPGEPEVHR